MPIISEVSRTISPNDEMNDGNLKHYFAVSESALRLVRLALGIADAPDPRSILDLPCGHGRVLRRLRAEFPEAALTACDINRDGVEFCAREFDARGVYSSPLVFDIPDLGRFDLIYSGSLLTHLREQASREFLDFFAAHLERGGILVTTLHGRLSIRWQQSGHYKYIEDDRFAAASREYESAGYGYASYPGSPDYGISVSRPSWAVGWAERRADLRIITFIEHGLDDHQDALIVQREI